MPLFFFYSKNFKGGRTLPEAYKTIQLKADAEFTEKRSRFIGHVCPAQTPQEAMQFVEEIRRQHRDARHNVFAYSLRADGVKRCSDDGEPQGTGGVPVLDVLEKAGIVDAVVVVTRYFGGVLLGAGGLVRAYSHAAHLAVEAGGVVTMGACNIYRATVDYGFYKKFCMLAQEAGATLLSTDFSDSVTVELRIAAEKGESLCASMLDISGGKTKFEKIGENFAEK